MSVILKISSGLYLMLIWAVYAGTLYATPEIYLGHQIQDIFGTAAPIFAGILSACLSVPAISLFVLGQFVGDIRACREHFAAVRQGCEPKGALTPLGRSAQ